MKIHEWQALMKAKPVDASKVWKAAFPDSLIDDKAAQKLADAVQAIKR